MVVATGRRCSREVYRNRSARCATFQGSGATASGACQSAFGQRRGAPDRVRGSNQADEVRGRVVALSRSVFPPAGDDSFYWVDLIGCTVVNTHEQMLGEVIGVDDHGAHALLQVATDPTTGATAGATSGTTVTRLIPFVSHFVLNVDMAARRILVDWELDY
ncbi:MAG: 16S rRNA processing protein RimM [Betaproteobacteria bacterium]|nr:16S rRNA processing protein RimM [Betaproteobacteria bacterium]